MFVLLSLALSWGLVSLSVCISVLLASGVLFQSVSPVFPVYWALEHITEVAQSTWSEFPLDVTALQRTLQEFLSAPHTQVGGQVHGTRQDLAWNLLLSLLHLCVPRTWEAQHQLVCSPGLLTLLHLMGNRDITPPFPSLCLQDTVVMKWKRNCLQTQTLENITVNHSTLIYM